MHRGMGKIIGLVAWVAGIVVFYLAYMSQVLQRFELPQNDTSRLATMLVFAGVWALVVNLVLYLLPTTVQSKLR